MSDLYALAARRTKKKKRTPVRLNSPFFNTDGLPNYTKNLANRRYARMVVRGRPKR